MPFPSPSHLEFFGSALDVVMREFRDLYAQLTGWLSKEHTGDGTHAHVTAYDVTVDEFVGFAETGARVTAGTGSPEGVVAAPPSSLWLQHDGIAGETVWIKETGTGTTGWLPVGSGGSGGTGAPATAAFVTVTPDATLTSERVLTGTPNQVLVTDDGAGTTVTLSTPQDIATVSTPQFGRMGLAVAADSSAKLKIAGQYGSTTYNAGNSSTAITLDWNNGNTQLLTLTGNCTLTLSNPKDGFRYILFFVQDGTGSRTVTWPAAVKWPGATTLTLTTTPGYLDLVTLVWVAGVGASGNYIANGNVNWAVA